MAEENSSHHKEQRPAHPFDQMMFGPNRQRSSNNNETAPATDNEDNASFDLFNTAQTMMETYDQLSPYVKGISNAIKKFKA